MDATTKPQSPFLPGTKVQFAWDSTSLGYLKTCPRLYQYIMIDGWSAKDESVHLRFGSEYHQAIQEYDIERANGTKHEEAIRHTIQNLLIRIADWQVDEDLRAGKYKNRTTLLQLCVDYFDFYADDPAQTLILDSGKPAVELSFKFELDWGPNDTAQPYILCGHLDRVVTFNEQIMVLDHKTTTQAPGAFFFNQFEPSNQMTLYTLAGKIVLDSPIKGVIIEAAQILLEKPNRFIRGFTYRTQDQLDEWVSDLGNWFSVAEAYADANYWPMNDTACDKFGGCKFRDVCSKSPNVRNTWLAADFTKLEEGDRWNPLKAR